MKSNPYNYDYQITDEKFAEIVALVVKRHEFKRVVDYFIEEARVYGSVSTLNGNSTWNFCVDFNCDGSINGNYVIRVDNENSLLPRSFAESIHKELIYLYHKQRTEEY